MEETAKARVELDGQQPKNEISELREQAKALRKELRDMTAKNDLQGVKELEKKLGEINTQMGSAKKTLFDYNQVLKNLNGSSIKDLERAQSALSKEIKTTARGTDEYIKKTKQYKEVRSELSKTRSEMGQFTTSQNMMVGLFSKGIGIIGGFYGALKIGEKVIGSTQMTADAFERTMAGLNGMVDKFFISISSGDWSNFWEGLSKSKKAAEDLADTMDVLGDLRRGYAIEDAKLQNSENEILLQLRDKTGKVTIEEKKKLYAQLMEMETNYNAKILEANYRERDAILKVYSDLTGLREDKIFEVIGKYSDYEAGFNIAAEKLKKAKQEWLSSTQTGQYNEGFDLNEYISKLSDVDKMYTQLYLHYGNLNDAKLDKLKTAIIAVEQAMGANSETALKLIRVYNEVFKVDDKKNNGDNTPIDTNSLLKQTIDDITNEWIKASDYYIPMMVSDLTDGYDQAAQIEVEHIKTNAEYELELYAETTKGKKDLLLKRLQDGKIAEREYNDAIKKIDEENNNNRLAIYAQFFGNVSQLFRQNTAAYKITASAEAVIATYAAAAKANEDYSWPMNLIVMASVIASGLAQVAKINAVQFAGGGYTGDGGTYEPAGIVHKGEYVIKKRQMQDPNIRGIVDTIIEPDRLSRINYESAYTSIANMRGYATGGQVNKPSTITNVNVNADQSNQILSSIDRNINILASAMLSGGINAKYDDREVQNVTKRQGVINKIKSSVRR